MQPRKQTLSIEISTPTLGWKMDFVAVYEDRDRIIAIAQLQGGSPCASIGHCDAKLQIDQEGMYAKPVTYFLIANRSGWWTKGFQVITNLDEIISKVADMRQVFSAEVAPSKALRM
jgi:hypothetical protein